MKQGIDISIVVVQISDTVYPMYKAYIEPDLKTAQLKIYNTFNPFSGFMDPTYILKSAQRVSKDTIHSLLKVTFTPDAANFRFCKFVLCQSAIRAHLVGLSADTKQARALIVQRKVRNQIYALQSWRSVQCPPPCLQCPPPCVQCVHHLACSAHHLACSVHCLACSVHHFCAVSTTFCAVSTTFCAVSTTFCAVCTAVCTVSTACSPCFSDQAALLWLRLHTTSVCTAKTRQEIVPLNPLWWLLFFATCSHLKVW